MDPFVIKSEPKDEQECCIENCEYQLCANEENTIVLKPFPEEHLLKQVWCNKIKILSPNWNGITENAFVCHAHLLKFPTLDEKSHSRKNKQQNGEGPLLKKIKTEPKDDDYAPTTTTGSTNTEFILPNVKEEKLSDTEEEESNEQLELTAIKTETGTVPLEDHIQADDDSDEASTSSGTNASVQVKSKAVSVQPKQRSVRLQVNHALKCVDQMSQTEPPRSIGIQCNIFDSEEESEDDVDLD